MLILFICLKCYLLPTSSSLPSTSLSTTNPTHHVRPNLRSIASLKHETTLLWFKMFTTCTKIKFVIFNKLWKRRVLLLNPFPSATILKCTKIPKFTYPEFFSLCTICHQMCYFWIKVFSNNSTHVMDQCHQSDLKRKIKQHWLYDEFKQNLNNICNSFSIYLILSIYKVHTGISIKI